MQITSWDIDRNLLSPIYSSGPMDIYIMLCFLLSMINLIPVCARFLLLLLTSSYISQGDTFVKAPSCLNKGLHNNVYLYNVMFIYVRFVLGCLF